MEPSHNNSSPRGHLGHPCAIHGWGGSPNPVALAAISASLGHEGEEEGEKEDEESREILVVPWLLQRPLTRWTVMKSINPRGRPQGTLAPRSTTPFASPTPSLIAPPASAPPPSEADPSGSGTPPYLKSSCDNRIIRLLAHFASPTDNGHTLESWDLTIGPSH
jgi:hypothetical protein